MSRTDAHVPWWLEGRLANRPDISSVRHSYGCRFGLDECDADTSQPVRCVIDLPRWASRQPWERRGTATIERRSSVRSALRKAATAHRSGDDPEMVPLPDPHTYCLCQTCGVGGPY